jgi:hypothetical protein
VERELAEPELLMRRGRASGCRKEQRRDEQREYPASLHPP